MADLTTLLSKFLTSLYGGSINVTGSVLVGNGSAAAPSYSFGSSGNTDNGMFLSASDTVAWSAGGTQRLSLSATALTSTVPVLGPDGTAAAPTFSFGNVTNSGMYNGGVQKIGWSILAVPKMRLDGSNGNLEIASNLSLAWNSATNLDGGSVDTVLSRGAANRLDLASGDSLYLVSGGLGVGVTPPASGVSSAGPGIFTGTAPLTLTRTAVGSVLASLSNVNTGSASGDLVWEPQQASAGFYWYTRNGSNTQTAALGIDRNGNVAVPSGGLGVGVTPPSAGSITASASINAGTNATANNFFGASYHLNAVADGQLNLTKLSETAGVGLNFATDGILKIRDRAQTGGGSLNLLEQTAPSAPSANEVVLYAVDNGAGKTQLMALFASGAAQQVAIQP